MPLESRPKASRMRSHGGKDGRPLSAASVRHAHRALRAALEAAVKLELLSRNVCAVATVPAADDTEVEILDADQIAAVLEALRGTRLYPITAFAIATGCRRGEIAALEWRDITFNQSCVRIERSMEQTRGGLRVKGPKSKHGRRTSAVAMLREHRGQVLELRMQLGMGKLGPHDLVFSDHEGRPISPNNLSVMWRRAARPLGLAVRFHSLRHSHASALIAAGVDVVTVSKRLGHGSAAFTLKTYAHLFANTDAAAAAAVDGLLR